MLKKLNWSLIILNIHTGAALYELLEPAHARKILEKIEFHYNPSMAVG